MFLYELAVELDVRSLELIDAAADLGLGSFGASTVLSPEQIARLRSHLRGTGPTGGLAPARSQSAGPEVVRSVGGAGQPSFEPPVRFEAPPLVMSPSSPPVAPGAPIDGSGPPGPIVVAEASTEDGFNRNQLVAIGAVIAAVVALFGFMLATGGRDRGRERAIAAGEVGEPTRSRPSAPSATTTIEGKERTVGQAIQTADPDADRSEPADLDTFCDGGFAFDPLLTRIVAAMYDQDIAELRELVSTRRGEWDRSLDQIERGGPPVYADEVETFRSGMARWFADIEGATTIADTYRNVSELELARTFNAGHEFMRQIPYFCK